MKPLKNAFKYSIFLLLGAALIWWQFSTMSAQEKTDFLLSIKEFSFIHAVPVIILSIISNYLRAVRWKQLIIPLGYNPKTINTFGTSMIGFMVNLLIPRLGEVIRASSLGKYENIPTEKLIGTVILERLSDVISFIIVIIIAFFTQTTLINSVLQPYLNNFNLAVFLLKLLVYILVGISTFFMLKYVFRRFKNNIFINFVNRIVTGIWAGIISIKQLKNVKSFIGITALIWMFYVVQIFLGFQVLPATASLPFSAAFSVLAISTLAMIITPGGLGSFPLFVMQVLLLYHVPATQGKAFGWVIWGVNSFIYLFLGLLFTFLLPLINKNKQHEKHSPN